MKSRHRQEASTGLLQTVTGPIRAPVPAGPTPRRTTARHAAAFALVLLGAGAVGLAACGGSSGQATAAADDRGQGPEHGLVLTRSTARYLVVMDVLAPERMFTSDQMTTMRPASGELVVDGRPGPIDGADMRHVEVHVYSLETGRPVTETTPHLTLVDHTAGTSADIDATLMHDITIGMPDAHFGTNTRLPAGHAFTLHVSLGADDTEFAGVLP